MTYRHSDYLRNQRKADYQVEVWEKELMSGKDVHIELDEEEREIYDMYK